MTKQAHNIWKQSEYIAIGEAVGHFRREAGITATELERRAGLTRNASLLIEKGERRVDVIELCRIGTALGVDLDLLFQRATSAYREIVGGDDSDLLAAA